MRPDRRRRRGVWWAAAFFLPDLAGAGIFALLPFLQVLIRSFQSALGGKFVGIANYRSVIGNAAFLTAVKNTLRFSLICIPLLVGLSLALAAILQRLGQRRALRNLPGLLGALQSAFLLPVAVPAASVVLSWKVLFHGNGLLNAFLSGLGQERVFWMNSGAAFWVLVLSYLWKNLGYDMILWTAAMVGIPTEIYEAARVDGAGEWACFWRITMPNLKDALYTISLLSFLNSFKVFREAWLVAGDYPHESMYLLQHLYNNWFRELAFDKISAAAVLNAAVVAALILLLRRREKRIDL